MTDNDPVNHPAHYVANPSGVECIDVVEHMPFNLGNATKYIWRAGLKSDDPVQDLQKAIWYLTREIERLRKFSGLYWTEEELNRIKANAKEDAAKLQALAVDEPTRP